MRQPFLYGFVGFALLLLGRFLDCPSMVNGFLFWRYCSLAVFNTALHFSSRLLPPLITQLNGHFRYLVGDLMNGLSLALSGIYC